MTLHRLSVARLWKPEQLKDFLALTSIENTGALHYFREAINASTQVEPDESSARACFYFANAQIEPLPEFRRRHL